MIGSEENPIRPANWSDTAEAIFREAEEKYMPEILKRVRTVAAAKVVDGQITFREAFRAFEEELGRPPEPTSLQAVARFVRDNLFLIVAVILTLSFGWLALYPIDPKAGSSAQSFLDIAKIFAGAIAGGAATSAVVNSRSKG